MTNQNGHLSFTSFDISNADDFIFSFFDQPGQATSISDSIGDLFAVGFHFISSESASEEGLI
jgi:hypothetical protein